MPEDGPPAEAGEGEAGTASETDARIAADTAPEAPGTDASGGGSAFVNRPAAAGALLAEAEMSEALGAVEAAGIEVAVLKGIPLARRLFGHVDARGVPVDTDLLVRRSDVEAAVRALLTAGYTSAYLPASPEDLGGTWKVVLRRRVAAGVSAPVELHWAPFSPVTFPISESTVWQHVEPLGLPTRTVLVPDRLLTLVLAACHFVHSGLAEPRILMDLSVAWRLWGDDLDVAGLAGLLVEARAVAAFAYGMGVARNRALEAGRGAAGGSGAAGGRGAVTASDPLAGGGSWIEVGSSQAALALRLLPTGRDSGRVPDYRGQLWALLLCHPTRLPAEIRAHLLPSRAWIAVGTDRPLPSGPAYALASLRRLVGIVRGASAR